MTAAMYHGGDGDPTRPPAELTVVPAAGASVTGAPGTDARPVGRDRPASLGPLLGAALLVLAAARLAGLTWSQALFLVAVGSTAVAVREALAGRVAGDADRATQRRSGPRRSTTEILVVGDEEFCHRVTAVADAGQRVVGRWIFDHGYPEPAPRDERPLWPAFDELVVDGRCFGAVRDRLPPSVEGRCRIRVVPVGRLDENIFSHPIGPVGRAFKRSFDIVLSLGTLLLAAPCLLLVMLAIRLDSRGPALFRQVRVGEGGRRFTLFKLRTMTVGEEDPEVLAYMAAMVLCEAQPENGMFKLGSNRRITRVGRVLRRLSVDEVPQLWNVLKGDMSLIGPRPPILEEAACYDDFHWQRLAVRPGITGLAQVNGRSRLRFDDIVTLDIRYSRSWSVLLELKILLRTPAAVFSGRGAT